MGNTSTNGFVVCTAIYIHHSWAVLYFGIRVETALHILQNGINICYNVILLIQKREAETLLNGI